MCQGDPGIRGPGAAAPGGTIDVEVGGNEPFIDVSLGGGSIGRYPVDPNGKATIPLPQVPAGTVVFVSAGRGLRRAILLVEIVDQD